MSDETDTGVCTTFSCIEIFVKLQIADQQTIHMYQILLVVEIIIIFIYRSPG